jgi:hypothetical protein
MLDDTVWNDIPNVSQLSFSMTNGSMKVTCCQRTTEGCLLVRGAALLCWLMAIGVGCFSPHRNPSSFFLVLLVTRFNSNQQLFVASKKCS